MRDLIRGLIERFQIDETTAETDIRAILRYFAEEGLLREGPFPDNGLRETQPLDLTLKKAEVKEPDHWPLKCLCKTPNQVLEFCSEDIAAGKAYRSLMSCLSVDKKAAARPDAKIWVMSGSRQGCCDIALNGHMFFAEIAEKEVLPHVFILTFALASKALEDKLLFHAAVLGRAGKVVVFPGETGCGKTTLAAALIRKGWTFFSDELAVLDPEKLTISPFPLPMSIKSGSMPMLEPLYPGLGKAMEYPRPDKKTVRYLLPPSDTLAGSSEEAEVAAIVFPGYRDSPRLRLMETKKITALQCLAQTGSTQRELQPPDIQAMITLVKETPCYDLFYSDIQQIAPLLEKQLGLDGRAKAG